MPAEENTRFSFSSETATMFVIFCLVYAAVEFTYLSRDGTVSRYKHNFARVQNIATKDVRFRMWPYGVLSYVVLFAAVWYFLVSDVMRQRRGMANVYNVISRATVLALAIYAIYNLTNAATLHNYDFDIVLLDTLWGVFAVNAVALIMWVLARANVHFRHDNGGSFV